MLAIFSNGNINEGMYVNGKWIGEVKITDSKGIQTLIRYD
jgi:hypothetical protein